VCSFCVRCDVEFDVVVVLVGGDECLLNEWCIRGKSEWNSWNIFHLNLP
jgi:hypothetical protein